jgi:hypothetical protein
MQTNTPDQMRVAGENRELSDDSVAGMTFGALGSWANVSGRPTQSAVGSAAPL